jgi:HK97 family phage major capsid protein
MYFDRGHDFVRKAIAVGAAESSRQAADIAAKRYGFGSKPVAEIKAAVAAGVTTDSDFSALAGGSESAHEFLEVVRELSLLGRLQNLRRIPSGVPVNVQTGGSSAYWVGQHGATPVSRAAFERKSKRSLRIAAISVFSNELFASASPEAEDLFRRDLIRAAVELEDLSFIDPSNAGISGTSPASITYGVTPIASTGDVADDIDAAITAFTGSLLRASWICHPRLAAQIGIRAGGAGVGCDVGARGGSLAGLPVLTSESVPSGSDGRLLILVDAGSIIYLDEGIEVTRSGEVLIEMSDTPTGDGGSPPVAASSTPVSLFQTDSTALKMVRHLNFERVRDGAVVVVEGCDYAAV